MRETQGSVNLSFSIAETSVTLHEPAYADFSVHNGLSEEIEFDLGPNCKRHLEFTVLLPDKTLVRVPRLDEGGIGYIGRVSLESHETYAQRLLLNEWYDFAENGRYTINGMLSAQVTTGSGTTVTPKRSTTFQLEVLPRNPQRLRSVCQTLLDKALKLEVAEAVEAALALSHIRDPLAVPFLEEGLRKRNLVWQYAIPGLARIGDRDAIAVLIAVMNDRDPESGSSLARFLLRKLSDETEDFELRAMIEGALAG